MFNWECSYFNDATVFLTRVWLAGPIEAAQKEKTGTTGGAAPAEAVRRRLRGRHGRCRADRQPQDGRLPQPRSDA